MYKAILVTGGAGFAGSALSISLKNAFQQSAIIAFDNLRRRGSERNLSRLRSAGVQFIHGDVRSLDDLLSVRPCPDLIVECSAEPSAQAGYDSSCAYLVDTNLLGCYHCLELARRARSDFLFVSTSRVYPYKGLNALAFVESEHRFDLQECQSVAGVSAAGISEYFPLAGPRSLYGMSKLAAELMTEEYADAYGFRYIIDRFGVLAGPYQMGKTDQGVIALWVASHIYERPLAYIGFGGTGKQVRDFLHIDDFCEVVLDQVQHFDAYACGAWNIGGGIENSVSLLELTQIVESETGKRIAISSQPATRTADVRIYISDSSRVSAIRGWRPKRDAAATIRDIARWIEGNKAGLEEIFCP